MSEPDPTELLADPLSDIARKERRNLLVASTVGFLVSLMGLVPTRFSAFDIELSTPAQNSFVRIVAVVITYFAVAFVIYGTADFFIWRKKYQDHLVAQHAHNESWSQQDQENFDQLHNYVPRIDWLYYWSKPLSLVRFSFEFVLPVIIGVSSACLLVVRF